MDIDSKPNQAPSLETRSDYEGLLEENEDLYVKWQKSLQRISRLEAKCDHQAAALQKQIRLSDQICDNYANTKTELDRLKNVESQNEELNYQVESVEASLKRLHKRLKHFTDYRFRIQKWVRPSLESYKSEIYRLSSELEKTAENLKNSEEQRLEQKVKLSEAYEYIQQQNREKGDELKARDKQSADAIASLQEKVATYEEMLAKTHSQLEALLQSCDEKQRLIVKSENTALKCQRELEEAKAKFDQELNTVRGEKVQLMEILKSITDSNRAPETSEPNELQSP
ncbi:MAG: hypothetical protein COT74_05265 [Bdellovibrionales bacterium CG10_big_fil_rev_8_21_14_0_10_45_34]|nr:MAG: hypothetical protein COT74_05265 [Bdellovibrionales bacterium CG10_big_fil_rev_8_21_14_0_10_45_34]